MSNECASNGGGSQSIEDEFHAGNYVVIVRERVDGSNAAPAEADHPFLIGALAFVGRLEDARALLSSWLRDRTTRHEEVQIVAARFFLAVAYCRAGRTADALRDFLLNVRSRHGSPVSRFYVFQGLGCYRYFTGRLRKAAALALCALEYAFTARFQYGRLLATDLRGHALVQLGQIQNGLSVLETARALAGSLTLPGNAGALDCAIAVYRARFGALPVRRAIETLAAVVDQTVLADSYSERSVRLELAVQTALAGDGDAAWRMLERLTKESAPDGGDARARIRFLLACANVARLRHGAASMRPFVREARTILANGPDIALEIDVLGMELVSTTDPETSSEIRSKLVLRCEQSGIQRAWLHGVVSSAGCAFALTPGAEVLEQDRLGVLHVACREASPSRAIDLLESGHFGLLPVALGLAPGRRLLVLGRRLVVEDHGNVDVVGEPPQGTLRFLSALAGGARRTKAELLALVWGIDRYRPMSHDAVIHTAVSRLRAQLGPRGHWVEAALGGYRLVSGVEVVNPFDAAVASARARSEPPSSGIVSHFGSRSGSCPPSRSRDGLLALLEENGASSSREVASRLGVSEMTALRRLREYVEQGAIMRDGKGKNTRYRLLRGVS